MIAIPCEHVTQMFKKRWNGLIEALHGQETMTLVNIFRKATMLRPDTISTILRYLHLVIDNAVLVRLIALFSVTPKSDIDGYGE
jgi:hypothetical protein